MQITLSHSELNEMLFKAGQEGGKYVLQNLGLLKSTYTRAEVVKAYGRAKYEQSIEFVTWQKKGGKTSSPICQREDFDKWITKFDAELKPLKK